MVTRSHSGWVVGNGMALSSDLRRLVASAHARHRRTTIYIGHVALGVGKQYITAKSAVLCIRIFVDRTKYGIWIYSYTQ